jgi:hypothetical protein
MDHERCEQARADRGPNWRYWVERQGQLVVESEVSAPGWLPLTWRGRTRLAIVVPWYYDRREQDEAIGAQVVRIQRYYLGDRWAEGMARLLAPVLAPAEPPAPHGHAALSTADLDAIARILADLDHAHLGDL